MHWAEAMEAQRPKALITGRTPKQQPEGNTPLPIETASPKRSPCDPARRLPNCGVRAFGKAMGSASCYASVEGIPWDGRGCGIPLETGPPGKRRGGCLEFCTGDIRSDPLATTGILPELRGAIHEPSSPSALSPSPIASQRLGLFPTPLQRRCWKNAQRSGPHQTVHAHLCCPSATPSTRPCE